MKRYNLVEFKNRGIKYLEQRARYGDVAATKALSNIQKEKYKKDPIIKSGALDSNKIRKKYPYLNVIYPETKRSKELFENIYIKPKNNLNEKTNDNFKNWSKQYKVEKSLKSTSKSNILRIATPLVGASLLGYGLYRLIKKKNKK
jgi:hypothetical protein